MPIEVRRFGVGTGVRKGRPGRPGSRARSSRAAPVGSSPSSRSRAEARITPHTNPNAAWFVVIEGGGWVGVGDERTRVQAGEAVAWPPDVLHGAWTEGTHMRAIVIEFTGPLLALPGVVEVEAQVLAEGRTATPGTGELAPRRIPLTRSRDEEEPIVALASIASNRLGPHPARMRRSGGPPQPRPEPAQHHAVMPHTARPSTG